MTPTQTVTHIPEAGHCGCGSSDCHGECCKLECLTRPNFFCGQLLTDGDFKAMVDWIESKHALQRFRDGWGVACGLEVTCSHKHKEQNRVYVSSGYAVDCCGRDIVVCDPIWYDFKCEDPFDPCCRKPVKNSDPAQSRAGAPPAGEIPALGLIPQSELRAFEMCLRFDEQMGGGQRAMVRGNCYPMDDCQFTRVKEMGKLVAREIEAPCTEQTNRTEEEYRLALRMFLDELKKHVGSARELLSYVKGTLHTFCFVEEWLCELADKERSGNKSERPNDNLIFYIVQDWRNHYFSCLCDSCTNSTCDGVPLARVWVWNKREKDCTICRVVYVDSYPPYRRHLSRDCWNPEGCVDLSRYIWREFDEVKQDLSKAGFRVSPVPGTFDPSTAVSLGTQAVKDVICPPGGSLLVLNTHTDLCERRRVVTIEMGSAA